MLSVGKDILYKILNELNDRDLVKMFRVNHECNQLYNNQRFWLNRVVTKFPGVPMEILRSHKKNLSWSDYYINDLRKINPNNANKILSNGARYGRLDWVIIALNNGANINGDEGYPLIYASYGGYLHIVKYLTEHGADIHAVDDLALMRAIGKCHYNVVKYLIEHGANIHASNSFGIMLASQTGNLNIVKYLVNQGADIHAQDNSAIAMASDEGRLDVVKYLVEQGADIHAGNDRAIIWAQRKNHWKVVNYLENL